MKIHFTGRMLSEDWLVRVQLDDNSMLGPFKIKKDEDHSTAWNLVPFDPKSGPLVSGMAPEWFYADPISYYKKKITDITFELNVNKRNLEYSERLFTKSLKEFVSNDNSSDY